MTKRTLCDIETLMFHCSRAGILFAVLPFALATVAGCSDTGEEATAGDEAALEHGIRETGRAPVASYGGVCTATFVSRARCLITAAHCGGGSLEIGPDVNAGFGDGHKFTSSRRSLSLRDSTPSPRWEGGSWDWSPADDVKIVWAAASANPGPNQINHKTDYTPVALDMSAPASGEPYTIHGYGYNVCDETGDGVLRYGFFRGGNWTNSGSAVPGVRVGGSTLLKVIGNGNYGVCTGDSGSSVRSSVGVKAIIGWSINGSNDGYATTLASYKPWLDKNVVGSAAKFCNPNWPLAVTGPGEVELLAEDGALNRHRANGGDVDPWDAQAYESPGAKVTATNGATVRVRGNDPLAPAKVRITASGPSSWPASACREATAANPTNAGNATCTVTLDPTQEERVEIAFTQL